MAFAHYIHASSAQRSHDGWFIVGYCLFAIVFLAALYSASGGPGSGEVNLAATVAMP